MAAILTKRQVQVMLAIANGQPCKAIADDLGIAPRTVKFHKECALARLGAKSTPHAVFLIMRLSPALSDSYRS